MKELGVALEASKESCKVLMKYFEKGIKSEFKKDNTPVTKADKESEEKMVSIIKEHFPDHNFLCEEFSYKHTDSQYRWIIDPLDMTRNFVRGIPFFSNMIALEKKGKLVLGVIAMPAIGTVAYAVHRKGAVVNGRTVRVSSMKKLSEASAVFGDIDDKSTTPYTRQVLQVINQCRDHRGYGDALGYILLAQGKVDLLLDGGKPWDVAAGKIIVEEAGGKSTSFDGKDDINTGHNLSTNGRIHKEVLEILNKI